MREIDPQLIVVAKPLTALIHAVVDDFVHEVVQSAGSGRANVHGRAGANSLDPFQGTNIEFTVSRPPSPHTRCPLEASASASRAEMSFNSDSPNVRSSSYSRSQAPQ